MSSDAETGRNLSNIYAVAHPADGFGRYTIQKARGCIHVYFCMSIFAYNGFFNSTIQQVAHKHHRNSRTGIPVKNILSGGV